MDDPPVVRVGAVSPVGVNQSPSGLAILLGCAGVALASSFITPWLMSHCQPSDPLAIFVFAGFGTIAGGAFLVGSLLLLELPAWCKVLLSWAWGLLLLFSNVLGNRLCVWREFLRGNRKRIVFCARTLPCLSKSLVCVEDFPQLAFCQGMGERTQFRNH